MARGKLGGTWRQGQGEVFMVAFGCIIKVLHTSDSLVILSTLPLILLYDLGCCPALPTSLLIYSINDLVLVLQLPLKVPDKKPRWILFAFIVQI